MTILSKVPKLDFKSHNSLNVIFTIFKVFTLISLVLNFSFNQYSPDIHAFCDSNMKDSTDSCNLCVRGYPLLIRKDSTTHMHGLAGYLKEGLPVAWNLS